LLNARAAKNSWNQVATAKAVGRRISMAKIIEFYVPDPFPRKVKWVPSEQRGRVIEFPKSVKKSA
jgi:predicted phosphatase